MVDLVEWFRSLDLVASRPLSVGVRRYKKPLGNTKKVLKQASALRTRSPLKEYDAFTFALEVIEGALHDVDFWPSEKIVLALVAMLEQAYHDEALSLIDEDILSLRPNSREAIASREYLRRQIRFIENYPVNMPAFKKHMTDVARFLMVQIPVSVLIRDSESSFLSTRFADLLDDVADVVDTIGSASFNEDLVHRSLLDNLRYRFEANVMNVSKIDPHMPPANRHRYIMPRDAKNLSDDEIVEQYLVGTPYRKFFKTEVPLPMNEEARFEHSHILGGTGHGKTQFIQKWITQDIKMAIEERRSVIVIDSQGDLINKIARLDCFNPDYGALSDKLVIIDPTDVEFPAAINMFAADEVRLGTYNQAEREKVQNSAIALYEHFFGELLGSELTAKQGVVFKYLARLMLEIPGATILTLRDLVDDPKPFIKYMDKLTGSARVFFAREFLDKSFNQTRKQISKRLWGVLSTPAFERLFSSTETKIDLFKLMNEGNILLISTAKDLLKQDGASLYGRFFLSMIGQAVMERAVIPEDQRTPTFLYVDECQDYFDETIEVMLAQGRKYKIGVTLSHQFMDQLPRSGQGSILANTSIKAAGGVNAKDARLLAQEMHTDAAFIQSMRKSYGESDFAFSIKHDLKHAIKVSVPFGHLESQPRMDQSAFARMLEQNRYKHCWRYEPSASSALISFPGMEPDQPGPVIAEHVPVNQPPDTTPPMLTAQPKDIEPVKVRGGKVHQSIQNGLKSLANQYGWRAEIEYAVDDGFVDVWLSRGTIAIACEISVTTPTDYEIHNIEKGLKAGADEVWVISENDDKLADIESKLKSNKQVKFMSPDNLPSAIESFSDIETKEGSSIRGFQVDIKRAPITEADRKRRHDQIARLLKTRR